jgi:hypothetical protein
MIASKYVGRLAGAVGVLVVALATWTLGPGARTATLGAAPDREAQALNAFANLPLAFVENHGQADSRVRFYAQGPRYAFHFTRDAALFTFTEEANAARGVVFGLRFVGGNQNVTVEGAQRAPGAVTYFRGNDPARWQRSLAR